MHPLDNVIWQALTTRQAQFAEVSGSARRFVREVTLLSGFEEATASGYASLAKLVDPDSAAAVFLDAPYVSRAGWDFIAGAPLLQMVCDNSSHLRSDSNPPAEIAELGLADSQEMLELTALTKPGPFGPRTHELGAYVGIRQGREVGGNGGGATQSRRPYRGQRGVHASRAHRQGLRSRADGGNYEADS